MFSKCNVKAFLVSLFNKPATGSIYNATDQNLVMCISAINCALNNRNKLTTSQFRGDTQWILNPYLINAIPGLTLIFFMAFLEITFISKTNIVVHKIGEKLHEAKRI